MIDILPGDRIRLLEMPNDPAPIKPGTTGQVRSVTQWYGDECTVMMRWDDGQMLGLVCPPDRFEVIARPRNRLFEGDPW